MGLSKFTTLKLTLPKQKQGEHLLVETRLEAIEQWLKSLPYGNMKVTLPALKKSISGFNRTDVNLVTRQNAMVLFNNSYQLVAEYYRPQSYSLDKRQAKISKAERRDFFLLSQEMAYGFKLLASGLSRSKGPNESLANILNLTLYYLSIVLMHHYDVYAPAPKNIWREIHNILGYSLNFDLIELELPESQPTGCLLTIEKTYLRITLLSLVNPYHLNQGQHWPIWRYLSNWVDNSELNEDLSDFNSDYTFVVDLKTDNHPVLKPFVSKDDETDILLLMTDRLIFEIVRQLDALETDGTPPLPGFGPEINATSAKRLLKAMRYHWQHFKKRISPRLDASHNVQLINGIPDIYSELLKDDPLAEHIGIEENEQFSSKWRAVNVSSTGLCLNTGGHASGSRIGQLIAVCESGPAVEPNDKGQTNWKLGITRWLKRSRREGITLGIEIIAGEVQPVMIKILGEDQRQELGFLVSGEEIEGQTTPTLIYAHGAIPSNQVVVMMIGDAQLAIKPNIKIVETLTFERVFYQTRELSEVYEIEEQHEEQEQKKNKSDADGNHQIELVDLPGFTQAENVSDLDLTIPAPPEED
jgi:hypothetical protein